MKHLLTLIAAVLATAFIAAAAQATPVHAAPTAQHADDHADDHGVAGHGDDHGHGAHHEPAGVVPTPAQAIAPLITAVIVFAIVCYVMYAAVWPKINAGLDERANKIRGEIAAAEAARAQAKAALEEYEKSLSQARAESQKMLEETKTKQAELAAELRAKNDREIQAMRDKAMQDIEAARKSALNEIYAESVSLATAMASKILQREVTPTDRERLIEESLAELGAHQN